MVEEIGIRRRYAALGETVQDTINQIVIGGRAFGVNNPLAVIVERNEIGKSAADIHG